MATGGDVKCVGCLGRGGAGLLLLRQGRRRLPLQLLAFKVQHIFNQMKSIWQAMRRTHLPLPSLARYDPQALIRRLGEDIESTSCLRQHHIQFAACHLQKREPTSGIQNRQKKAKQVTVYGLASAKVMSFTQTRLSRQEISCMFAGTGWLKRRITSSKTADSPVPTRTSCLLPILRKICKLKDAEVLLQGLGLAQKTTKFGHQIHIRQRASGQ